MINQKGGVFVRLSNYQIEKLYEVRKARSNDACGANAFNILGIDRDIIETMREGQRTYGTSEDKTLQQLRRFVNKVRKKETDVKRKTIWDDGSPLNWLKSPKYPTPRAKSRHEMPSEIDRRLWEGWTPRQRNQVKGWLKQHIPKGYITIIGIPGHWVIAGRTKNKGDLIIIESQQGGEGGVGTRYDCGYAGIYLGDSEVIHYIEDTFRSLGNIHDSNDIYLPNQVIGLSAVNPPYKEENYIEPLPTLPRQISTWSQDYSMSQQKPLGDGSSPSRKPQPPFPDSVGVDGPDSIWDSTGGPFKPSSDHPTRPTEIDLDAQAEQIAALGIATQAEARETLQRHNGDIERAVNAILNAPFKPSSDDPLAPHNFGDNSTIFDSVGVDGSDSIWNSTGGPYNFGNHPGKRGRFSIEELMKPRTKVIPGKFALKKR